VQLVPNVRCRPKPPQCLLPAFFEAILGGNNDTIVAENRNLPKGEAMRASQCRQCQKPMESGPTMRQQSPILPFAGPNNCQSVWIGFVLNYKIILKLTIKSVKSI
jgi:hypothetical protein